MLSFVPLSHRHHHPSKKESLLCCLAEVTSARHKDTARATGEPTRTSSQHWKTPKTNGSHKSCRLSCSYDTASPWGVFRKEKKNRFSYVLFGFSICSIKSLSSLCSILVFVLFQMLRVTPFPIDTHASMVFDCFIRVARVRVPLC